MKAGICILALDTSKLFGLQVVENRYKLDQVTRKDNARYVLSSDPIIGKLNDSTYCGHENFRSVRRTSSISYADDIC